MILKDMKALLLIPFRRAPLYLAVCSALIPAAAIFYVPKACVETPGFNGNKGA